MRLWRNSWQLNKGFHTKQLTEKVIVSDEELLTALRLSTNIRQALQSVGLAANGGNYSRVQSIKIKYNI